MALSAGSRLGPYEIVAPLGAGGMGEVYKATDTRLGRAVAVKVLPAHVAGSLDLQARFEREAKAISNLNHPNICTLHDIGRHAGIDFLVMEYLEGETLADRIGRGPVPLLEALRIGGEIADALDKAHRQGIVHRDLKPGNVMLTKVGSKLLDFGLAKLYPNAGIDATAMPTVSTPLTGAGTIVGTYQYMAPEQVEGREADSRTDIFAFGALLYEMVTGRRAFEGTSQASVMAAILKDTPPAPSALQPLSPSALDGLVMTCLAKSPDDRWQSAGDVGRQLKLLQAGISPSNLTASSAASMSGATSGEPLPGQTGRTRSRFTFALLSVGIVLALGGLAGVRYWPEQEQRLPVRFAVSIPGTVNPTAVVSPNGQQIVYAGSRAGEPLRLYVRRLDAVEATPLPGTEGAALPFWSADSRNIGFAVLDQLKRIAVTGGPPETITSIQSGGFAGGAWNANGDILFASVPGAIKRVPASGGMPSDVTRADGGGLHVFPSFLPDGRRFLFTRLAVGAQGVYIGTLGSSSSTLVVQGAYRAAYTPQGYLLFDRGSTVMAQDFDLASLRLSGEPTRVADGLSGTGVFQMTDWSVSNTGVLSYVFGGITAAAQVPLSRLTWYDRGGRALGTVGEPGPYAGVSLSPDGDRIAVHRHEDEGGIWIYDLQRNNWSQFTFDRTHDIAPLWSRDGRFMIYSSLGRGNIFRKLANGTGREEALVKTTDIQIAETLSLDGKTVIFARGAGDMWSLSLIDGKTAPVLNSPEGEYRAQISPDGRWLAYASGSGLTDTDIHVRAYPSLDGPWRISTNGGNNARWSHDGRELFYVVRGSLMAVDIHVDGNAISPGTPHLLFNASMGFELPGGAPYDVSRDGRFLVIERSDAPAPSQAGTQTTASPSIGVVLNWDAVLRPKN